MPLMFPIALAQVQKVEIGNTSQNLLKEYRQIIYFSIKQETLIKAV